MERNTSKAKVNTGKIFERQIKKSVPKYALIYRLPDAAQAFGGSKQLRFSSRSPFDYLLWDSKRKVLYALELKTVSQNSISFERDKGCSGIIHYHQIQELNKWNEYSGIVCGFIIEFRKINTVAFIDISDFNTLIEKVNKKSFSLKDLEEYHIPYTVINSQKLRTQYIYDIDKFLTEMRRIIQED